MKITVERVTAEILTGDSQGVIAKRLGFTSSYMSAFCKKHGLRELFWQNRDLSRCYIGRRVPAGDREFDMKARYESGETLEQISKRYSITRERVRQLLKMHFGFSWKDGGQHICVAVAKATRSRKKDQRYIKRWGHDFETHKSILSIGNRANPTNPIRAFTEQRRNALFRGIEWKFIFADWWAFWRESGKWNERGRHGDAYVMARIGDEGPYSRENCVIKTLRENSAEGQVTKKRRHAENLPVAA